MNQNFQNYDVIGDIHGHADTLRALLARLGYAESGGVFQHPSRRVLFVGDFVDRGPKIRETLQLVRAMIENAGALAVLGNHELNAIRYHSQGPDGKPFRPHSEKNRVQHQATLEQLAIPHPKEWADWLEWMKALPFYLDLGGLRVVHAAWSDESIHVLGNRRLTDPEFFAVSNAVGSVEHKALSILLNGPELALPPGVQYQDKEGHIRTEMRVRWFGARSNGSAPTYRGLVFPPSDQIPELELSPEARANLPTYGPDEPPVLFGHYWMPPLPPTRLAPNAACVDYSVASKGGGLLTVYRWNGETVLSDENFVFEQRTVVPS